MIVVLYDYNTINTLGTFTVTVEFRILEQFGYYVLWNPTLFKSSGGTSRLESPTALSYLPLMCFGLKDLLKLKFYMGSWGKNTVNG